MPIRLKSKTVCNFLEIEISFFPPQREANAPFNTIEDSGINTKFVNTVYDALLHTVRNESKYTEALTFFKKNKKKTFTFSVLHYTKSYCLCVLKNHYSVVCFLKNADL